jgi:uncharacterized protein (DUF111 family)
MLLVETTVDDVTGEVLGQIIERLLESGASDAWIGSVIGKKGRPAHVITALCHEDKAPAVERTMLRETGSLGARRTQIERHALMRSTSLIDIAGDEVRVKTGPYRTKPEFADLQTLARKSGLTLREVSDIANGQVIAAEHDGGEPNGPGGTRRH